MDKQGKVYKTAKGFLKHLSALANHQDMSDCSDWQKLSLEQQRLFYGIIAGIQNDLGDIERNNDNDYLKGIY